MRANSPILGGRRWAWGGGRLTCIDASPGGRGATLSSSRAERMPFTPGLLPGVFIHRVPQKSRRHRKQTKTTPHQPGALRSLRSCPAPITRSWTISGVGLPPDSLLSAAVGAETFSRGQESSVWPSGNSREHFLAHGIFQGQQLVEKEMKGDNDCSKESCCSLVPQKDLP